VARCQRADRTAFDEIVRRYKGTVRHRLYRMTGSTEDAEDLTQEVFVRMYTSIGSFRAEASLGAWLFRIAANLCVDTFRRSKNRRVWSARWTPRDRRRRARGGTRQSSRVTCRLVARSDDAAGAQGTQRADRGRPSSAAAQAAHGCRAVPPGRTGLRTDRRARRRAARHRQVTHLQRARGAARAARPVLRIGPSRPRQTRKPRRAAA
jgi:RNA polymerase sigma factor (sigma-70 family)